MERLRCTYDELQRTPEFVIEDVMIVMEAETKAAEAKRKKHDR